MSTVRIIDSRSASPAPNVPDYELLCLIGRGAYGEVWLARNVLGAYRAAKVVYRDAFEDERPYEREFAGIQAFEPVSRHHASQLDVLHVGRDDARGYFYSVMQLADDRETGQAIDPATYAPRTLKSDLYRRGRLPVDECVRVGAALATALQTLHEHGLVHRDVKPSNIIFVDGCPKLADIGLVAAVDRTLSYVGTAGYFPPEGPGTPQGDVYSLGKVLYEAATGLDRNDYPKLPDSIADWPDAAGLIELNEILLRASDPNPARRYSSAAQMREELAVLQSGRSVRRRRSLERLRTHLRRLVLVLGGVAAAVAVARPLLQGPRAVYPAESTPRDLPIEYPDTFLSADWMHVGFDWDPIRHRVVFAEGEKLLLWDGQTSVLRPIELPALMPWNLIQHPSWSPDGSRLAIQASRRIGGTSLDPIREGQLLTVNPDTGTVDEWGSPYPGVSDIRDLVWTPDGGSLTRLTEGNRILSVDANGNETVWAPAGMPGARRVQLSAYSPDGEWLTIARDRATFDLSEDWDLWLVRRGGGAAIRVTNQPGYDGGGVWSPNGRHLYFLSAGGIPQSHTIGIWRIPLDLASRSPVGAPVPVLARPLHLFDRLRISPDGRQLLYATREQHSHIWAGPYGRPGPARILARGAAPQLSSDGSMVYYVGQSVETQGVLEIPTSGEGRPRRVTGMIPVDAAAFALSPDDRSLAVYGFDGSDTAMFLVDVQTGRTKLIHGLESRATQLRPEWAPDGSALAYAVDDTIYLTPVDGMETGTPQPISASVFWEAWTLSWSPDGRALAALGYESEDQVYSKSVSVFVIPLDTKVPIKMTPPSEDKYKENLRWHPDGERLSYFYYGPERLDAKIKVITLADGRIEELIDQPNHWDYAGAWSPDGTKYYFASYQCPISEHSLHVYDTRSGRIEHGIRPGEVPIWSLDGSTMAYVQESPPRRRLEIIEIAP